MKALVLHALVSLQLVVGTNTVSQHISKTGSVPTAPDAGPGVPSASGGTGASDIPTFMDIVDDDLAAMALKFALSKPDPGAEDEAWQRVSAPRQPEWIYGRAVLLGAEPVGNKLTAE